ncbi:MAG: NAD(P)H-hydrate epimerase [Planctomycetes bacterium RBG_13_63_9]|nr:MAG: NAD(P)H-hydrate epimerase [Planctomycetes bacterium RBG_13_63_9]
MASRVLGRAESRRIDQRAMRQYGMGGLVLMENAGRGVADRLCQLVAGDPFATGKASQRIVICCGKGNNAGDGFVIARHLDLRGFGVRVLLWAEPGELTGDAAVNFRILEKTDVPIEVFGGRHDAERLDRHLAGAAWIVDALLGTGARGEPRPPLGAVIDQLNAAPSPILAVDLPSGLDCDTGEPAQHTIRAAVTCTFVALKAGFLAPGAGQYSGQVHVLDIGAPRKLVDEILAER